uniref:CSON003764 protein n=1 Tax=Culicoides sonorensis TaxID=179676 RepID=A0A336L4L5_CULSO
MNLTLCFFFSLFIFADFRINRFCNENLVIGNEIELPNSGKTSAKSEKNVKKMVEADSNEIDSEGSAMEGRGEPRAEARVQLESNYHQFTNLKIIKGTPEEVEEENRKKNEQKRRQRVYSQDFRLVKVLPSDSDKFKKVQKIGNEFYIRRDDTENEIPKSHPAHPNTETNQINGLEDTTLGPEPTQISPDSNFSTRPPQTTSATTSESNDIMNYINKTPIKAEKAGSGKNLSSLNDYEIIIREGKEVITIYPETITKLLNSFTTPSKQMVPENLTNTITFVSPYNPVASGDGMDTNNTASSSTTEVPLWKEELMKKYPIAFDSNEILEEKESNKPENETKSDHLEELDFIKRIRDSFDNQSESSSTKAPKRWDDYVENIVIPIEDIDNTQTEINEWGDPVNRLAYDDDDNDDDEKSDERGYDSDEDDDDDDYVSSGERMSSYRKVYSSIQRTALGKPLLQGFAMTPGYPKYYIGDMDCKWKIIAPPSQKIRLTILDLALRYDDICKDYLEVVDLELNRVLFTSCKESKKPIEIISLSNQLEISVKSVSKLAYPKRGVLIHYTGLYYFLVNEFE